MTESLPNHLDNGTATTTNNNKLEGATQIGDQQDEPSQLVQDQMHDEELEEDEEQDEEIYGQSTLLLLTVSKRGEEREHTPSLCPLLDEHSRGFNGSILTSWRSTLR